MANEQKKDEEFNQLVDDYNDAQKENDKLKQEINNMKRGTTPIQEEASQEENNEDMNNLKDENNKLKEENETLKNELNNLKDQNINNVNTRH